MKKKGYYEYIPHIYPRRLWVMYNTSEEEIDKFFTDMKGKPLVHNDEPMNEGNYGGMVYDECMSKAGNYLGNLVVFPKKKDMTMRNISHEAFRVLSSMNDACDLERFSGAYNEHQAYLMGWICDCINKARLGIGDICYNPTMNGLVDGVNCKSEDRSDGKGVIFKEVKKQKRKMKQDKYSLKISRNSGDTTLDGYPIATYSNDELKILKRLLTKVLGEVNEYIHL